MVNGVKRVDNISKEHKKYEEIVKDALNLHDKLLEMGFESFAEDALKIHDNLLEVEEKDTKSDIKSDIGKQVKKFEKEVLCKFLRHFYLISVAACYEGLGKAGFSF